MNAKKKKAAKPYIRNKNKQKARQQALKYKQEHERDYKENHENIIRVLPKGTPFICCTTAQNNYPRHKEWILKWKSPTDYKTQPAPDWLDDMANYNGLRLNDVL